MQRALSESRLRLSDVQLPDWYRAAIFEEAEALCRGDLRLAPQRPDRLHLLGLIAMHRGQREFALACLMRAIAIRADLGECGAAHYCDLGDALSRLGRWSDALGAYLRALVVTPHDADVHNRIGRTLFHVGRWVEAAAIHRLALQIEPADWSRRARTHRELGEVLEAQGRPLEAQTAYECSVSLVPGDVDGWYRLGRLQLSLRQWDLAISSFRHALRVDPDRADLHAGLSRAHAGLGALPEAIEACRAALAIDPVNVEAAHQLVFALEALGKHAEVSSAWQHLARALTAHRRHDEALIAWRQALVGAPGSVRARLDLGRLHLSRGDMQAATEWFDAALARAPDDANAHIEVGWACHTMGQVDRGWNELRWYFQPQNRKSRTGEQPLWDGTPLDGQAILLWAEPQLGDTVHFVRYVAPVVERGGRVIVECDRRLVPIVGRMPGVVRAVARGTPLPPFDVHAPLLLLPTILQTGGAAPPPPYLSVPASLVDEWRRRLAPDTRTTVGLSWAGKPTSVTAHTRFISLSTLAPLGDLSGVRFVSLQAGPAVAELVVSPEGLSVECLQDRSCSLDDTAALICNLDLVVSVDTMIAHLAGALGRPVWTLLPFRPDWRWPRTGDRTVWYPTMRLFRQRREHDWPSAIQQLHEALAQVGVARPSRCEPVP